MLPDNIVDIQKKDGELYCFRKGIGLKKQKEVIDTLRQTIKNTKSIYRITSLSQKLYQEQMIIILRFAEKYTGGSHFLIFINKRTLTDNVGDKWNEFYLKNLTLAEIPLEQPKNTPKVEDITDITTIEDPTGNPDKITKINRLKKIPVVLKPLKRIFLFVLVGILFGSALYCILITLKVSDLLSLGLSLVVAILGPTLPDFAKKHFNIGTNKTGPPS